MYPANTIIPTITNENTLYPSSRLKDTSWFLLKSLLLFFLVFGLALRTGFLRSGSAGNADALDFDETDDAADSGDEQ